MIELRPVDRRGIHAAFLEAFADYAMGAPTDLTEERLLLRLKKNAEDVALWRAFDGADCIGAVAYSPPLRWLLSLVVRRSHRRRRAGRALLAQAATFVPAGVTRLVALNVDGADAGMQAFLARLGFSSYVDQYEMTRPVT